MTSDAKSLMSIQRKLDRWELEHLREHSAELAGKLELALGEIARLERDLAWAEDRADMFSDLNGELMERVDVQVGLSKEGRLGVLHV